MASRLVNGGGRGSSRLTPRPSTRTGKQARHRRIVELLRTREIESQAELAKLLARGGAEATQATLSRDLEELGATKTRLPGGRVVYRVPEDPPAAAGWLQRMLREFAVEIDFSGNLCLVKTPPGGANAVARAIDNAGLPDVLGTIAGDDTIMICAREGSSGKTVARTLRALADGKGHAGSPRSG